MVPACQSPASAFPNRPRSSRFSSSDGGFPENRSGQTLCLIEGGEAAPIRAIVDVLGEVRFADVGSNRASVVNRAGQSVVNQVSEPVKKPPLEFEGSGIIDRVSG